MQNCEREMYNKMAHYSGQLTITRAFLRTMFLFYIASRDLLWRYFNV